GGGGGGGGRPGRAHPVADREGRAPPRGEPPDAPPLARRRAKPGTRSGSPPLRERIIASQRYDVAAEHVLVTSGTQHANFLAFASILERGDEAIVESPSWEQPKVLCEAFGVHARILRRRPELDWKFDLAELEALLSPRVKLIYLCHPSNPTGAVLDEGEVKAICELAGRVGAYVVSDEIYRGLEWDGVLSPSVVNHYERGVTTSSVSKTLGMSGLRLGWLATRDRTLIER